MLLLLSLLVLSAEAAPDRRGKRTQAPDLDEVAATLLGQALLSERPYQRLRDLCDGIGHRITGSEALEQAVAWGEAEMAADGLRTRQQPVEVTVWQRNEEGASLRGPVDRPLQILGLGNSVGTPEGGLEADVVVVRSFEALDALPDDRVQGRIVVFNRPFTTYGETVPYRVRGADAAARKGAVAALIRSVTPVSLNTPHTGAMRYSGEVPRIPAAALTLEDAEALQRMQDDGRPIRVHLQMGAQTLPDARSANVIGEIRGRERPEQVVTLGCHLDSWDVGQGAQDDGAGCVAVMEVGALLAALPTPPRRTVRVVLFTNEENGLAGGRAYATAHGDEAHVALLEMDIGAGAPRGWQVDLRGIEETRREAAAERVLDQLRPLQRLLSPLGADGLTLGGAGADVGPTLEASGALGLGLDLDTSDYWPIHHTHADTLDKVDPALLAKSVAALTLTAWWLAEVPRPPILGVEQIAR